MDAETFAAAHQRMHPQLVAWLRRRHGYDVAVDLADEVFAQAWESRHRYRPELGSVDAWLRGIAAHTSAGAVRRAAVAERHQPPPADEASDDIGVEERVTEALIASQVLAAVLAALTDMQTDDFDLITTIMVAALSGLTLAPLTNAQHLRLHRLRLRLLRRIDQGPRDETTRERSQDDERLRTDRG
ncbi:MAG: RNA polymerase sigma factor [Acidimicrobiales bacterium]